MGKEGFIYESSRRRIENLLPIDSRQCCLVYRHTLSYRFLHFGRSEGISVSVLENNSERASQEMNNDHTETSELWGQIHTYVVMGPENFAGNSVDANT